VNELHVARVGKHFGRRSKVRDGGAARVGDDGFGRRAGVAAR